LTVKVDGGVAGSLPTCEETAAKTRLGVPVRSAVCPRRSAGVAALASMVEVLDHVLVEGVDGSE
jgi:hypothetical protein